MSRAQDRIYAFVGGATVRIRRGRDAKAHAVVLDSPTLGTIRLSRLDTARVLRGIRQQVKQIAGRAQ